MSSLTIFVVPVFGIPASGKSTIIRALAERFSSSSPVISCKIIELDDILRKKQSPDQEKTNNGNNENENFDISKWFEAREEFMKEIEENVCLSIESASSSSQEQKEIHFIFTIDNLPLKSMRNRIKNLVSNKLKSCVMLAQSEQRQQEVLPTIYFQPICISVSNVEIAIFRNERREPHEKVPREIIESTFARIEIENTKDNKDLVVLNDENKTEAGSSIIIESLISKLALTEQISVRSLNEKILTELSLATSPEQQQRDDAVNKKSSFESFSHQFDLLRRQANSSVMQRVIAKMKTKNLAHDQNIPKNGEDTTKKLARILSDKKFIDVDRKILQELLSSSVSFDSDEILSMLLSIRDPLLAEFLRD